MTQANRETTTTTIRKSIDTDQVLQAIDHDIWVVSADTGGKTE
jgi:hypothetical protein